MKIQLNLIQSLSRRGQMKIQLKPDAKPLKKRPDRLNPRVKDKA